jgi:hypothetical protein
MSEWWQKEFVPLTDALSPFQPGCRKVHVHQKRCGDYEGDPHSPPEREAARGAILLTPFNQDMRGAIANAPAPGGGWAGIRGTDIQEKGEIANPFAILLRVGSG